MNVKQNLAWSARITVQLKTLAPQTGLYMLKDSKWSVTVSIWLTSNNSCLNLFYNKIGRGSENNFFLLGFGATELIAATMMEIKLKWLVSQRKRSMSFVKIQANAFRD